MTCQTGTNETLPDEGAKTPKCVKCHQQGKRRFYWDGKGWLCGDCHSRTSGLHMTAARIRFLPRRRDSDAERLESAGRLLITAIDAGAFEAPEYAGFLVRVQQRFEQKHVNEWISAWAEATWWLKGKPEDSDIARDFASDCELVADTLTQQCQPPLLKGDCNTRGLTETKNPCR